MLEALPTILQELQSKPRPREGVVSVKYIECSQPNFSRHSAKSEHSMPSEPTAYLESLNDLGGWYNFLGKREKLRVHRAVFLSAA